MKSGRPRAVLAAAALSVLGVALVRADFPLWVQHTPAGPAVAALFRSVAMPGGAVPILRPPAESRPALTNLIAGAPREALLYRLRAQEAEVALDFTAAEADWKTYAANAADHYAAQVELADFYQRRLLPREELSALSAAATAPDDPLQPAAVQRGWHAFERMASVIDREALPAAVADPVFRAWVARYPKEPLAWRKLIEHLGSSGQFAAAEAEIARYGTAFHDALEPLRMRADLQVRRGSPAAALALYDRAFQPLWPEEMTAAWFKLLEEQGQLREFAGRARTALESNPANLDATARLYRYFRAQNNGPAARRALLEYRMAKESGHQPWTAEELQTLAQLFEWLPDVDEAARLYYALYSVPPSGGPQTERALYGLAHLLLTNANLPIQFGSGDLSFYKDIATLDPSPGFLNGILSLILNGTGPRREYQRQDQQSTAYFHRAAAARLVTLLEQRFPRSSYRDPLRAALVAAYVAYGDDATVIRTGREYLAAFPAGAARVSVAMEVSDALARANRTNEEFALYDQLLRELAAKASGVPIGSTPPSAAGQENQAPPGPRSGPYIEVLDKYLSRLAALKRPLDALRVYRTEIDRNPNDPGLYERLAGFLEYNGMARDVEDVYTRAIAKFADRSWYHKLARWYLRRQESSAFARISRDVIAVFSGSELEGYFSELVAPNPDAALYLQLNLYAHERFPEGLAFVRNLLGSYSRPGTANGAAYDRLLRQYWFYDPQLRTSLFQRLSQQGRLYPELAEIRAANPAIVSGQFDQALAANPAAVQFVVEAEAWLSHFEAAAPAARALAGAYPGKSEFAGKASSLYRSLAAYDVRNTDVAITMAGYEQRANPGDQSILARMGDILADRELFARARTFWERMPTAQPRNLNAWLDTATVYWDYYRFDDALRWIAAARKQFDHRALFAYQAGAIYEGKRDYTGAVREYTGGAVEGQPDAEGRLLRLARRPQTRDLVDRATAAAVAANPSPQAVSLRISVLESLQRRPDLEALLRSRVEAEKSSAELTQLQETARRLGFDAIEERAGERLNAITSDPVDKMRLTLVNVRLLESKQDIPRAARVVDALYHDHPLILGVVRGAVDFHVRNKQPGEAIDLLLDAAKHARADLADDFTLESVRIATEARQFDRARTLLAGLLSANPLRADYLASMADTYLQAGDDRGFRDYQLATIQRLKQSQLTPAQRIERIATIRRGLIPALDRLNDAPAAVDQYIEVIDSYPEDEALTKESAAYAVAHNQAARMLAFYRKTVTDAPLDYRWPIVLGRIETVTEDFPTAIADYERALKARPDRADVLQAKARLEERLMRFDDAIKSYGRLYELAYRDPQWMIKVAELRARSGQAPEAVDALKTAIIGTRTETADADFQIAAQLEAWHILPDAAAFAERGANLQGGDLFKDFGHAMTYARILTQTRRLEALLPRLGANPGVGAQLAQTAGQIVAELYTPEEKIRLEQALISQAAGMPREARNYTLLPLPSAAGLVDLESRWLRESMTAAAMVVDQRFVVLQSQRGLYGELGRQLEEYAAGNPGKPVEDAALIQAADAFLHAGDPDGQVRVLRKALAHNGLSGDWLDRYLGMLVARQPDELLSVVRNHPSANVGNRAVQLAIAAGTPALAYSALQTRGRAFDPVWTRAFTALTGEYFDDHSPAIDAAFQAALDTRTIGERLKAPLKPDQIIAGAVWFYYGSRYGDHLATGKNAAADQWLPAYLEADPEDPDGYMALGETYAGAGQGAKAIAQYEHALELDADRGDAHDRIACVLWSEGRRPEAVTRWKTALATFLRIQSRGIRVPEPFWHRVAETFTDMGERHALGELRAESTHLLGDYYQRNNEYRLHELIEPAARASIASGEGTGWLVELARSTSNPEAILRTLIQTRGLTDTERISLQRDVVTVLTKRAEASFGDDHEARLSQAVSARVTLVSMLLNADDVKGASAEWSQIPAETGARRGWQRDNVKDELEIRLASKAGTLPALLARYRAQPETAPSVDSLRNGVMYLRNGGDENGAWAVLEFLYDRELHGGNLQATSFIGLAEVKLARNDTAAALALLNRMALVIEDGSDTLLAAADLLGSYGKTAEAADFIRRRVKAVPWDSEAKAQLARTLPSGSAEREQLIAAVVTDRLAPYKLRAEAARMNAPRPVAGVSGTELALLSAGNITADAAAKPFQVEARIDAAGAASAPEAKLRLWLDALSLGPTDARAGLGALRAALALRRDNLALAIDRYRAQTPKVLSAEPPYYTRRGRKPEVQLTDDDQAALAESLAAAAERIDDLNAAQQHLMAALSLWPASQRDAREALLRHRDALTAEQQRRAANSARQPVVKDVIEQDQVVRPRIPRSAQ